MTEHRRDSSRSLRRRLIVVAIAGTFVASFLAAATGLFSSFQRTADSERERLLHASELIAQSFGQILRESMRVAGTYSSSRSSKDLLIALNAGLLDRNSFETTTKNRLSDLIGSDSRVLGITRLDQKGRVAAAAGAAYAQENWPEGAVHSNVPEIRRPFFQQKAYPRFSVSIPIQDDQGTRIGTDIVFFDGKPLLVQLTLSSRSAQYASAFLVAGKDDAVVFLDTNGIAEPSRPLIAAQKAATAGRGVVKLQGQAYGYASAGEAGWVALIEARPRDFFSQFWGDLKMVLVVTVIVAALTASAVALLLRPLAKGLLVRAETLEAEVESRTKELSRQKHLVENIIENVPHGVFWKDRNGVYQGCSPVFVRQRGFASKDDVIGRTLDDFRDLIVEVDAAIENDRRILATGTPSLNIEETVTLPDGSTSRIITSKVPLRDADGSITGILGVFADITTQKKAEEAWRESERRLSTLMSNLPGMAYRCRNDVNWTMEFVSDGGAALTGYRPEDIVGNATISYSDIILPEDRDEVARCVEEAVQAQVPFELNYRIVTASGVVKSVLERGEGVFDADGKLVALEGFISDITGQKRAEEALRLSEERFRSVIDHSSAAIILKDRGGRYLIANREFLRRNGKELHQVLGRTTAEILPEDLVARASRDDREVLETGKTLERERTAIEPDGTEHTYLVARFPLRDSDGTIFGIGSISSDITERKRTETELSEQRELLDTIIETIPHGLFWKNRDLVYAGCNTKAAHNWFLDRREDLIGKSVFELARDKKEAEFLTMMDRKIIETGEPRINFEDTHVLADGTVATHLSSKLPLRDAEGNVTGLLCVFLDITDRKSQEAELAASEARFRDLIEGSIQGTYIHRNQKIVFANQACTEIFGYANPDELFALDSIKHLYDPEAWAEIGSYGPRRLAGEDLPTRYETKGLRADGSVVWVESQVRIIDWYGSPAIQCNLVDITDRKAAERQLRHTQRMRSLGNLAGGVAHELNNLLLPIQTLTQMTIKKLPEDSRERAKLEKVVEASVRAKRLVAQVMEFSRQEEGERIDVEIQHVVKQAAKLLKSVLPSTLKVKQRINKNTGWVHADPSQVQSVVMNLASNAADACQGQPGEITISLTRVGIDSAETPNGTDLVSGSYAKLTIKDTGKGMDAETIERVFDPFFTTKEVGEGTGLGLSMVHGIVSRHQGVIDISSIPGQGTEVDVYLPILPDTLVEQTVSMPQQGD